MNLRSTLLAVCVASAAGILQACVGKPAPTVLIIPTRVASPPVAAPASTALTPMSPTVSSATAAGATPTPSGQLFADDFTNTLSGWDVRRDADAITDYQNGEFIIMVGRIDTTLWSKPNHYFTDAAVEVDAREAAGPDDNLYGVICRYTDSNNFYRLVIAGNGFAGITKRTNGVVKVISAPALTRSPAVNRGQASNHLKAVCQGSQLTLYVNGQLVAQATDDELSGGDVGLLASAGKHPGVEIRFSNFVVSQP